MDLIDLDLVVRVNDAGSITHGAADAHLALPSASARIRALERSVGTRLFDRDRRGVTPTPAGMLLLRHARSICRAVDQMRSELAEYAESHGTTVRVLANTAAMASVLPTALPSFMVKHQNVGIDLDERTSYQIVAAVTEGRAELGIAADSVTLGQLEAHTLRPDPLVVIAAPGHPLTEANSVRFKDALEWPFVGLGRASALQEHLEGHALPLGSRPRYRFGVPSIDTVCHTVAAGIGIAILPECTITSRISSGRIAAIPLDEPWANRKLVVCYASENALTRTGQALRDHLIAAHSQSPQNQSPRNS